jgi:predicted PurR-regulated permease PerM
VFTETYVTAIFGGFDSAEFCSDPYTAASSLVLVSFILLSLLFAVFMNAMIAFISEEFANILDYQGAILAREMACLIVDMYDTMSEEERKKQEEVEKYHKWVYKLSKQADLDKMGSDHTDAQADGRRATKQDILSVDVKLKKENAQIKKEIAEVRNENSEMRSSLERMEKEMKSIKSGVENIKSGVENILLAMSPESK